MFDENIKCKILSYLVIRLGVSETTFVQSFNIRDSVKKNKYIKANLDDVSICDCPGFEDTRGIDFEMVVAFEYC